MSIPKNVATEAATDGACSGNPGKGGWGGLIIFEDGSKLEIGGSEENTTNNRMELTAAIKILEKLKEFNLKENFKLRTDSKYVIEGYTNWINNWKKNGWKTSSGKTVLNIDLWQRIDSLRISGLNMEFVKGHNGDPNNERVDLIATNYSKGISLQKSISEKSRTKKTFDNNAPEKTNRLLSRLQLISEFAKQGYLLKSNELYDLLDIKNESAIENFNKFNWRNWTITPINKEYWQISNKT